MLRVMLKERTMLSKKTGEQLMVHVLRIYKIKSPPPPTLDYSLHLGLCMGYTYTQFCTHQLKRC